MIQIYLGLLPYIRSKELRVLAVLDDRRSPYLPGAPRPRVGYDVTLNMWETVLAPKGTPEPIMQKLSAGFAGMVKDPALISAMEKSETPIIYQDRHTFQKFWDEEYKKLGEVIDRRG